MSHFLASFPVPGNEKRQKSRKDERQSFAKVSRCVLRTPFAAKIPKLFMTMRNSFKRNKTSNNQRLRIAGDNHRGSKRFCYSQVFLSLIYTTPK